MTTPSDPAALPLRVIGMPGAFADWGLAWVCQILEQAGQHPQVVPLAEAAPGWRIGFGHAAPAAPPEGRSVVFLDTPAAAVAALLGARGDALEAVRELTGLLAPLPALVRAPGTLLVRRDPAMDVAATRAALARHLLPALTPPETALPCEAGFDPAAPDPPFSGQALALVRQVVAPMLALAAGATDAPIVWPLSCFYSGDQPGEQAAPIMDTTGPARILYYGPYFHLPPGRWQVAIQMFFSNDVPASMLAAEIRGSETLARIEFRPAHGGLFQADMTLPVARPEERIELRLWLLSGTISGQFGLRQVLLTPPAAA